MKTLKIRWQRLVDESGITCTRCKATEKEVEKAFYILKQSFAPRGLDVILEKAVIDSDVFAKDPLVSNRLWIDDRPLEEWLKAQVGKSPCCSGPCHNEGCRTITLEGRTYEMVPAELIIEAGLLAASRLASQSDDMV